MISKVCGNITYTFKKDEEHINYDMTKTIKMMIHVLLIPGLFHFTLDPYLIMLSVKQGSIKYHFLSLLYDSTWD